VDRSSVRYHSRRPDDAPIRSRLRARAPPLRLSPLHILRRREGLLLNHKKRRRRYGEERLQVRRSRPTRKPDSEVSAISATHSRVKSSTTSRMRKRLGVDGAADFTASLTCRLKTDTAKGLAAMATRQNPNEWWTKI
jgi:hypothetical protein